MSSNIYSWLVSFAAGLGGFCFGYEIGVIGQVLPMQSFGIRFGYRDPATGALLPNTPDLQAWITTSFSFGTFFGAGISTQLADFIGRKWSIILAGLLFSAGGAIQASTDQLALLIFGRVVSGLAIGVTSVCVPLYIAEAAPTNIRGRLITVYQLMITIGIFIATAVNALIILSFNKTDTEWRLALGMQVPMGIFLSVFMYFLPFSPRWLLSKERGPEALAVLSKLRGADMHSELVRAEFTHISESVQIEREMGEAHWKDLFVQQGVRNRTFFAVTLQAFQQFTAINVILYYGPTIADKLLGIENDEDKLVSSVYMPLITTLFNVLGTIPGMALIERLGRRRLLGYGGVVMATAHLMLCLFASFDAAAVGKSAPTTNSTLTNSTTAGEDRTYLWLSEVSINIFILAFSASWGPVVWVYQSEIFPLRVRAKGTGLATMSNWAWNAFVANTFPRLFAAIDKYAYLLYSVACFVMAAFVFLFLPETGKMSLEDMDEVFGRPPPKWPREWYPPELAANHSSGDEDHPEDIAIELTVRSRMQNLLEPMPPPPSFSGHDEGDASIAMSGEPFIDAPPPPFSDGDALSEYVS
ncbi:general substrate transporter, partial [Cladochytrium replicatum]